jgi:predicted RNA-binding Zn-ribbon protein involved in translation (DUF1610 family)
VSRKINLEKVKAALKKACPKCGHAIEPSEIRRLDSEEMECPKCLARFDAQKEKN